MATTIPEVGVRPLVGTSLMGAGTVTEHSRVLDSIGNGRWHGLIRLVIDGANINDLETWTGMLLKGAVIKVAMLDFDISNRIIILYKFEEN